MTQLVGAFFIFVLTGLIYFNTVFKFCLHCRIGFGFLALNTSVRFCKVECRENEKNENLRTNYKRFLRGLDG